MRKFVIPAIVCLLACAPAALAQVEGVTMEEYEAMSTEERKAAKAEAVANHVPFTGTLKTGIDTNPPAQPQPTAARATMGTITYDAGVFDTVPTQPAGITDILSFGNQFNTQNGGPIPAPTVTVTQIAVWPALIDGGTSSGSGFLTIFGPVNTAGTNAAPVNSTNQPDLQPGAWNTVAQSGVIPTTGTAASFLIGMFGAASGGPGTPCDGDCPGFDTGDTVGGQGFHAMHIDDFSGGDFGTISNANALIRAIGNVVPVELLTFSIEGN
ncbi:MAG: hypothetical protein AAGD06_08350 [Acidobacteriota bacterium]